MKIFLYRPHDRNEDVGAIAYDEEGNQLGGWVSSSLLWAKRDLARYVPEGAEVVWCIGREQMQAQIDSGAIRGLSFGPPHDAVTSAQEFVEGR
jgi:hypothetical protein